MRYIPPVGFVLADAERPPQSLSVPVQTAQGRTSSQIRLPTPPSKKQTFGKNEAVGLALLLGGSLWGLISRVVIAILLIVGGIAIFHALFPDVGLNEHSTCQQFEQADTDAQNRVLQDMLTAHNDPNPSQDVGLARFSVEAYCFTHSDSSPIDGIYSSGG